MTEGTLVLVYGTNLECGARTFSECCGRFNGWSIGVNMHTGMSLYARKSNIRRLIQTEWHPGPSNSPITINLRGLVAQFME